MKCPKCSYLGFEDVDRCRNCGYDFSLIQVEALPELSLRDDHDELNPLDDLALVDAAANPYKSEAPGLATASLDRTSSSSSRPPTTELPLFGLSTTTPGDDGPLITRPAPPRAPLAVRRATPEVPRLRASSRLRTPMLDLNAFDSEPIARSAPSRQPEESSVAVAGDTSWEPAGVLARTGAALVDLIILAAIDIVVVYLTMQICGVTMADLDILPKGPLVAFLMVQNLGYFIGLTRGGQTLGKMATGIKVVSAQDNASPDIGHSALRTLVWVALAAPAGLGFLTALFGDEYRGLHDRCAGTKVVRATT